MTPGLGGSGADVTFPCNVSFWNSQRFELTFIVSLCTLLIKQNPCGNTHTHTHSTLDRWDEPQEFCQTYIRGEKKNIQIRNHPQPHVLSMYIFQSMYITTLHCCSFFLAHFLRSSICSTSLDSSTTLPLTIVCVTTFTIFRVLTSGSSAKSQNRVDHFT